KIKIESLTTINLFLTFESNTMKNTIQRYRLLADYARNMTKKYVFQHDFNLCKHLSFCSNHAPVSRNSRRNRLMYSLECLFVEHDRPFPWSSERIQVYDLTGRAEDSAHKQHCLRLRSALCREQDFLEAVVG
ncbi:MAG: hypothetical protein K2O27_00465, partial [Candidatus Amulumruptor sp.]|nr:hypothetical protein [Candidatus Amulumruptor sp.]